MIYTSYFAKLKSLPENIIPISICGKTPDWYKGIQYKRLAPKYEFFMEWKKNHDNEYFIGYGKWDKQIRKAKLYHATNWAEKVMNDPRFYGLDLKVVKVIIYEEEYI